MFRLFTFTSIIHSLSILIVKAQEAGESLIIDMETSSTNSSYDIGSKIAIIIVFLAILFLISRFIIARARSQKIKLPKFLSNNPIFKDISQEKEEAAYKMTIVHREQFSEGNELMVLDVNGRHLLLSKNIHGGIMYLTDLESVKKSYEEDISV